MLQRRRLATSTRHSRRPSRYPPPPRPPQAGPQLRLQGRHADGQPVELTLQAVAKDSGSGSNASQARTYIYLKPHSPVKAGQDALLRALDAVAPRRMRLFTRRQQQPVTAARPVANPGAGPSPTPAEQQNLVAVDAGEEDDWLVDTQEQLERGEAVGTGVEPKVLRKPAELGSDTEEGKEAKPGLRARKGVVVEEGRAGGRAVGGSKDSDEVLDAGKGAGKLSAGLNSGSTIPESDEHHRNSDGSGKELGAAFETAGDADEGSSSGSSESSSNSSSESSSRSGDGLSAKGLQRGGGASFRSNKRVSSTGMAGGKSSTPPRHPGGARRSQAEYTNGGAALQASPVGRKGGNMHQVSGLSELSGAMTPEQPTESPSVGVRARRLSALALGSVDGMVFGDGGGGGATAGGAAPADDPDEVGSQGSAAMSLGDDMEGAGGGHQADYRWAGRDRRG